MSTTTVVVCEGNAENYDTVKKLIRCTIPDGSHVESKKFDFYTCYSLYDDNNFFEKFLDFSLDACNSRSLYDTIYVDRPRISLFLFESGSIIRIA
jgi:hypothetical protein